MRWSTLFAGRDLWLLRLAHEGTGAVRAGQELLPGDRFSKVAVPIVAILLTGVIISQHSGFPHAGPARTIAHADGSILTDSAGTATNSFTRPKLNSSKLNSSLAKQDRREVEPAAAMLAGDPTARSSKSASGASATASSSRPEVAELSSGIPLLDKQEGGIAEPDASKSVGAISESRALDGLVASWFEPPVRNANKEQPPFTDLGVMPAGAGVEHDAKAIASGITVGFGAASTNSGVTISVAESKMNTQSTEMASLVKEDKRAIEPDGSKLPIASADSPTLNDGVVSKLQPAPHKTDQRPPAPTGLRVVWHN